LKTVLNHVSVLLCLNYQGERESMVQIEFNHIIQTIIEIDCTFYTSDYKDYREWINLESERTKQ